MENIKDKTADLIEHARDLADTWYQLTLAKVVQKTADLTSSAVTIIIAGIAGFFFLLFGGLSLSWWLGDLVKSRAAGFLLGASVFLVGFIIFMMIRKKVIFPFIRNLIIRNLYD